jgi:hypothetical protein
MNELEHRRQLVEKLFVVGLCLLSLQLLDREVKQACCELGPATRDNIFENIDLEHVQQLVAVLVQQTTRCLVDEMRECVYGVLWPKNRLSNYVLLFARPGAVANENMFVEFECA